MSELPQVVTVTHHVARNQHQCCECGGIIAPLDVYERTKGNWDGNWSIFKVCVPCIEARDWLVNETEWKQSFFTEPGIDWEFGNLRQHLMDYGAEGDRTKRMDAYRYVVRMNWRRQDASDMFHLEVGSEARKEER